MRSGVVRIHKQERLAGATDIRAARACLGVVRRDKHQALDFARMIA
jgi:hypothetical protein